MSWGSGAASDPEDSSDGPMDGRAALPGDAIMEPRSGQGGNRGREKRALPSRPSELNGEGQRRRIALTFEEGQPIL